MKRPKVVEIVFTWWHPPGCLCGLKDTGREWQELSTLQWRIQLTTPSESQREGKMVDRENLPGKGGAFGAALVEDNTHAYGVSTTTHCLLLMSAGLCWCWCWCPPHCTSVQGGRRAGLSRCGVTWSMEGVQGSLWNSFLLQYAVFLSGYYCKEKKKKNNNFTESGIVLSFWGPWFNVGVYF